MENTLLVTMSRQMSLQRELDVVSNNVANINTSGFKRDNMLFNEYLSPQARGQEGNFLQPVSYVIDRSTVTDLSAGTNETTGGNLDFAVQGNGFFAVQTPQGERYTRAGSFTLNASGELVTQSGDKVLGDGGPITFTQQDGKISVGSDGTISTSQGQKGKLRLVSFTQAQLKKEGDNLFSSQAAGTPDIESRVLQGALEKSNVKPVNEIARLIEITRSYTTIAQMIENTSKLRQTAIERLSQTA